MATTTTALADSYTYLTVSNNDNTEQSYTVSQIEKITFEEDNMVVYLTDGTKASTPLPGLGRMFFSDKAAGIFAVSTSHPTMRMSGGMLTISQEGGAHITLYNIKGSVVKQVTSSDNETTLNLRGLQQGVYIVKVNGTAQKIMNK